MQGHDRMMTEPHEGMSSFWRKNTSSVEAVELANLIRALRKVTGHLGPAAPAVEYAGMAGAGTATVFVDPSSVMGTYPVPPDRVDAVAGEVVHEAMLAVEWSERVWKALEPCCATMEGTALIKFQRIVKTAEDIFVDFVLQGSTLGEYLSVARRKVLHGGTSHMFMAKSNASFDALVLHWWAASFGEKGPFLPDTRHEEPLGLLMGLTVRLIELAARKSGIVAKCSLRSCLYKELWKKAEQKVRDLALIDRRIFWLPDGRRIDTSGGSHANPRSLVMHSLPQALLSDIEMQLAATSADITPLIRRAVGPCRDDVAPTSRWDYTIPAHPVVDRVLARRINAIFRTYSAREAMVSRGLTAGKVDARRLYRAAVNGRCFTYTSSRPAMDWNVTLLIDASGSMRGPKWRIVENTVSTLHWALTGYRNCLSAYAYFEVDGICMISSLVKDGRILSVPPSGRTASGQAIIAAALFMPPARRRRVLIHITDGGTNFGVDVSMGIAFCRARGIHLMTLGCGCRDTKAMEAQYGGAIEFIGGFGVLPQAIERLLRMTFLYRAGSIQAEKTRHA